MALNQEHAWQCQNSRSECLPAFHSLFTIPNPNLKETVAHSMSQGGEEEYEFSFPLDDGLMTDDYYNSHISSSIAVSSSPAKTSMSGTAGGRHTPSEKKTAASKASPVGRGRSRGKGSSGPDKALPPIGKLRQQTHTPTPGESTPSRSRLRREKGTTAPSTPAAESEDLYQDDDFCPPHHAPIITTPTIEQASVKSLPRVAVSVDKPSGSRLGGSRNSSRTPGSSGSHGIVRPSTQEKQSKMKVEQRNLITNQRQMIRESSAASGPKIPATTYSLSVSRIVSKADDTMANTVLEEPSLSSMYRDADPQTQLLLVQHHCSGAKLRYLELSAQLRTMDQNTPSHLQTHSRTAVDVYNALSTLLYTCLSVRSMQDLHTFILQSSLQLPAGVFDYAEWRPIIDIAMKLFTSKEGKNTSGVSTAGRSADTAGSVGTAESSIALTAGLLKAKSGEIRRGLQSMKREIRDEMGGLFEEFGGRLTDFVTDFSNNNNNNSSNNQREKDAAKVRVDTFQSHAAVPFSVLEPPQADMSNEKIEKAIKLRDEEHAVVVSALNAKHLHDTNESSKRIAAMTQQHDIDVAALRERIDSESASHKIELERVREAADRRVMDMAEKLSSSVTSEGGDASASSVYGREIVARYESDISSLKEQLRESSQALKDAASAHRAERDELALALTLGEAKKREAAAAEERQRSEAANAEERALSAQRKLDAYRADKEAVILQLNAKISEITEGGRAESRESSSTIERLNASLAQLQQQLQLKNESPTCAVAAPTPAPAPVPVPTPSTVDWNNDPILLEKNKLIEELRKQVADMQTQLLATSVATANKESESKGDESEVRGPQSKRRGSHASASPRSRIDSSFLKAYGNTKQGDSGWYIEKNSVLFYFCLDDMNNYTLLCGPISIAMYKHACDEVKAITKTANKRFSETEFAIDSTCLLATRLQIDQLIEENALHLQAVAERSSRTGSRRNSFSFSLSTSRRNSISSQNNDMGMLQQLVGAPAPVSVEADRLGEQKQFYENQLLLLQNDLCDLRSKLQRSAEKLKTASGKMHSHVYEVSSRITSNLNISERGGGNSEKRVNDAVVGIQSAYRGYAARKDFYKHLRRHVARRHNMLAAIGKTVQGTTGWYCSPEGAVFYFGLERETHTSADDKWKLIAGPISYEVYRSLSQQARYVGTNGSRRLKSGNNNELSAVMVVNDISLSPDLRGHVYLDSSTEKLLIVSLL